MHNKWFLSSTALLAVVGLVSLFIWLRQKFGSGRPAGERTTVPSDDLESRLRAAAEREQRKLEMRYGPTISLLVDRCAGLRVEVYANEHPPPHFHVKCAG